MNSQLPESDAPHTGGITFCPTFLFVVAYALNVTPHEIVHALTSYSLGFNSTVFQMWVNPDSAQAFPEPARHHRCFGSSLQFDRRRGLLAACRVLCPFCSVDPLFSTKLWTLLVRAGGRGYARKKSKHTCSISFTGTVMPVYRWPEEGGNTVCWDGGIGTSPLRSRQRMEFNIALLASSAWCQFIAADAFAPAAVGPLAV